MVPPSMGGNRPCLYIPRMLPSTYLLHYSLACRQTHSLEHEVRRLVATTSRASIGTDLQTRLIVLRNSFPSTVSLITRGGWMGNRLSQSSICEVEHQVWGWSGKGEYSEWDNRCEHEEGEGETHMVLNTRDHMHKWASWCPIPGQFLASVSGWLARHKTLHSP